MVHRGTRLVSAHQEFRIRCDGEDLASATLIYSCHSPAVYRRLRGDYGDVAFAYSRKLPLPQAIAPHLVAREHDRDVVLSPPTAPPAGSSGWTPRTRCSSITPWTTRPAC